MSSIALPPPTAALPAPSRRPRRAFGRAARVAALCLLTALPAVATPTLAAAASCADTVTAAADEAQRLQGLTGLTVRTLVAVCGDGGPAAVVDALTRRGDCGDAAQLGRSLPAYAGMSGAVTSADRCLGAQVSAGLDGLADAAPDADGYGPVAKSGPPARGGDFGDFGGVGVGGVETEASGRSGYGSRSAPRPTSEPASRSAASTGMGSYVPSPQAKTTARIAEGTRVAWSRVGLSVWFDFDSASLRPEAFATLGALADQLAGLPGATVMEVVGHTDSLGSASYNEELSRWRASSVMYALRSLGVAEDRLDLRGAGEYEPVQSNASEWGRAMNRRVEFQFYRPMALQITR